MNLPNPDNAPKVPRYSELSLSSAYSAVAESTQLSENFIGSQI
jgi:hypothetical protein